MSHPKSQTILIRVDSSVSIGTGHLMRCLALATELRERGAHVTFVSREHSGHLCDLIAEKGFTVLRLPKRNEARSWLGVSQEQDAEEVLAITAAHGKWDWIIVDHYEIDAVWEKILRPTAQQIMVIDDLANRPHDCDLLLDQTLRSGNPYLQFTPKTCGFLLGPSFALLRKEFQKKRSFQVGRRFDQVKNILVYFGGSDATGETLKTLVAAHQFLKSSQAITFDIVVGVNNSDLSKIEPLAAKMPNVRIHKGQADMAALMTAADLCIGAGGATTWERACLGLPSLVIGVADNQIEGAQAMAKVGAHEFLGQSSRVDNDMICKALLKAVSTSLETYSKKSSELVDGLGAVKVAERLLSGRITLQKAISEDCRRIWEWRNAEENRRFSNDPNPIVFEDHSKWFEASLKNPSRQILICKNDDTPIGVLRFDFSKKKATVSIYLVPDQQGKGYGARVLQAGTEWLVKNRLGIETILAEVLAANTASQKAFTAAGYAQTSFGFQKDIK